jgi:hypothetical protein
VLEKIKVIFSIIGAVLSVVLLTILLFLLCRGKTHGQGSGADSYRADGIEEGIGECTDRIRRCEERLQGAENILREAIRRSREQEQKA